VQPSAEVFVLFCFFFGFFFSVFFLFFCTVHETMDINTQSLRALSSYVEFELRFYSNRTCRASATEKANQDVKLHTAHSKRGAPKECISLLEDYHEYKAIDSVWDGLFWSPLQNCFVRLVCVCFSCFLFFFFFFQSVGRC